MIDARLFGRSALATGAGSLFATLVAIFLTYPAHQPEATIAARIVLVTGVLLLLLPVVARDLYDRAGPRAGVSVLAGSAAGFVLDVANWVGRGYAGQVVHSAGVVTVVIDLVLWLAVTGLAVRVRLARGRRPRARSAYLS